MADQHVYLIVREGRVVAVNRWLKNHADLDVVQKGGGERTFDKVKLALLTDPDDGSVIRARACLWKLSPARAQIILNRMASRNPPWKVNTTDLDNDLSWYRRRNWTKRQVLDDVTRKPRKLKLVPVETGP